MLTETEIKEKTDEQLALMVMKELMKTGEIVANTEIDLADMELRKRLKKQEV